MKPTLKAFAFPLIIIAVGVGWLLTTTNVLPGVNWVWILSLGLAGVLVMGLVGIDKATMVIGPFLIVATIFSLLRQTGRLSVDLEVPILVITLGVLFFVVQWLPLPGPKWLYAPPANDGK